MNGGADLGGMMGFGPVVEETNEPYFHAPWEERVLGMTVALGASKKWNLDQSRFARESMPTTAYLSSSYYEIWLHGITKLLKQNDMVSEQELQSGQVILPALASCPVLQAAQVERVLMAGGPVSRDVEQAPVFEIGQRVRTLNMHPESHTRLPRYARDKLGVISQIHGFHVFPDANALGLGEQPTWLYKVSFDAKTLWGQRTNGNDASTRDKVHLDLWQPYLTAEKQ